MTRSRKQPSGGSPPDQVLADIVYLSETIGPRLAGSAEEARAAAYIAERFHEVGVREVVIEPTRVPVSLPGEATLNAADGRTFAVRPVMFSPGTGGQALTGRFANLGTGTDVDLEKAGDVSGAIGLHFGPLGETRERFDRLVRCGVAALLWCDDRIVTDFPISLGMPGAWAYDLRVPWCAVSYYDAWKLALEPPQALTLRSEAQGAQEGSSQNVVALIEGAEFPDQIIAVTGHHDTQWLVPGATDNASGSASAIALAGHFAQVPCKRSLLFASVGAEEQLSSGAWRLAFDHRDRAEKIRLVVNNDSNSSAMGQLWAIVTAKGDALAACVDRLSREHTVPLAVRREIVPYSDQFPFNVLGAPSVWFHRTTTAAGYHSFHSHLDTAQWIRGAPLAELLALETALVRVYAEADPWPLERGIDEKFHPLRDQIVGEMCFPPEPA